MAYTVPVKQLCAVPDDPHLCPLFKTACNLNRSSTLTESYELGDAYVKRATEVARLMVASRSDDKPECLSTLS